MLQSAEHPIDPASAPTLSLSDAELSAARAPVEEWIAAFNAGDVERILATYTPDALVHGTFNRLMTSNPAELRAYLSAAAAAKTQVALAEYSAIVTSADAVTFAGFYDFSLPRDGKNVPMPARFSFLVVKRDGRWLIAHQHSSIRPSKYE